jgi:hypothetical protein
MAVRQFPRGPLFFVAYMHQKEAAFHQFGESKKAPTQQEINEAVAWCAKWIAAHPPPRDNDSSASLTRLVSASAQRSVKNWRDDGRGNWIEE